MSIKVGFNSTFFRFACVCILLGLSLSTFESAAFSQTITVNTVADVTDFGGTQQVEDLPGPDGRISFREAILASDNTPGPQTIEFAIPESQWWLFDDRAMLRLEDGAFSINGDETTVDFTSQTNFTGDTNADGWEVGIYGLQPNGWGIAAIFVNGDNCVIKGLDRVMQRGFGVELTGNFNRVISCTISGSLYAGVKVEGYVGQPAIGNIIGGNQPGEGNVLSGGNSGVRIDGPTDGTVVIGNTLVGSPFSGVEVRGAYCCPDYTPFNTQIGGPTPEERNWIADNGKFGEEGFPLGSQVQVEWAVGTTIEGNYIGTTRDGSARFPSASGTSGVTVRESVSTIIRDNLISGIRKEGVNHHAGRLFGVGIQVSGLDVGTLIEGNLIGTDASGQNPVPNLNGISLGWFQGDPVDAMIGGSSPHDRNIIAFNERVGITISSSVVDVGILGNSLHSNGLLGIDLLDASGQTGVSPNDQGDGDLGGNGLQNFPVLNAAITNGSTTTITGSINTNPNTDITIQFFSNSQCNASGHGEGETYLGETALVTDGSGDAVFEVSLDVALPTSDFITSTTTAWPTGATSEFSECIPVQTNSFGPDTFEIAAGNLVAGTLADLMISDNADLSARRNLADTSSRVFLEVESVCPIASPTDFQFTVEASVFARSPVIQSIDFYNFDTGLWEEVDSRNASQFVDLVTRVGATGDLSRFIHDPTGRIRARCRFESIHNRQQFSVNVDQTMWTLE